MTHPVWAAMILLGIYGLLSLFNATGGYLGTDTGAKVITLDAMVESSTLRPDVGYWAESWDPNGVYHPLLFTEPNDRGEWVNVTTLPMLIVAHPMYALGGYRLALLPAMLGSVLAAFAGRNIARQLGDGAAGWRAYWTIGLASPLIVYALDFWEHSLGAGLMVASFALLLRSANGVTTWRIPLGAGLLLGASASMRTETFVVASAIVGATCVTLALRRRIALSVAVGLLCLSGFAAMWALNGALESALGGQSRADRVEGVAGSDVLSDLPLRGEEALITWFAAPNYAYPGDVLFGAVFVGAVALAWWFRQHGERRLAVYAVALGSMCFFVPMLNGLGFVPGALIASPVAIAAIVAPGWSATRVLLVGASLVATALTWLFQYTGGANPQWGGRYLLAPTIVLTAVGAVALARGPVLIRRSVLVAAVAVSAFGVAWVQWRTAEIDDLFDELSDQPEDVIISTNGWFVREGGPITQERRYLSLGTEPTVEGAVADVVRPAGFETFGVLGGDPEELPGATLVSTTEFQVVGTSIQYHSYRLG